MTLIESMSGTRGIVGKSLTTELIKKQVLAFTQTISKGTVIVGGDTRTSFNLFNKIVTAELLYLGFDVISIGKVI